MNTLIFLFVMIALVLGGVYFVDRAREDQESETEEPKVTTMLDCEHCGSTGLSYHGPAKPVDAVGLEDDEELEPVESSKHKYECLVCGKYSWKHERQLMKAVTEQDKVKSPSWAAKRPPNRIVRRLRMNARAGRMKAAQGA